jgi:GNAT superfamily N-acetyltransferase
MLKERTSQINDTKDSASTCVSHVVQYTTARGPLFLQSCCNPALVEALQVDEGLRAFARTPDREHQLLLDLASKPENRLTLAYTPAGKIVGQATLAPLAGWWRDIGNAYEIAVEVSPAFRNLGVAHQLLSLALDFEGVEKSLVVGLGFSWHWDYAGLGLSRFQYREVIARLFAAHGFAEYLTSEPNIRIDPANILLARLGRCMEQESMSRFFEWLLQSDTLPGL